MNMKPSFASVVNLLGNLNDAELAALVNNPKKLKELAAKLVSDDVANTFFVPIADKDLPAKFKEITVKWRRLASDLGYTGPIVWRVREGFTLKDHAPKAGPCHEAFEYIKDWKFQNDEPTKSAIVFWIPRLLENSKSKTVEEQSVLLAETCKRYSLSEHHMFSFGSATMLSGLILAHFKRTGEKAPLNCERARTDTLHKDGNRLNVNFGAGGLDCDLYNWDGGCGDNLGAFPLGVELV